MRCDTMSENETLKIAVELKGDIKRKYEEIKNAKGIKQHSDLVRLLIAEYYLTLEA